MCKTSIIEFLAGYYEWNLYINGKLVYTFDEGISEWITNNTKKDDFKNIVEMFVDGMIEEMEETGSKHISSVKNNMETIINKMLEVWVNYFGIEG